MRTPLVIVGAGGHARELLDIVDRRDDVELLGFLSELDSEHGSTVCGHRVLGGLRWMHAAPAGTHFVLGVGDPDLKRRLAAQLRAAPLPSLVDPSVHVSRREVTLGAGVVLCAHSLVSNHVRLGDHVHVNRGAQVAHDCTVGAFTHISPGAVLSGRVTVGEGCEIGANATILPGRTVADGSVVGAGAVVTRDVPHRAVVAGVPARALKPRPG